MRFPRKIRAIREDLSHRYAHPVNPGPIGSPHLTLSFRWRLLDARLAWPSLYRAMSILIIPGTRRHVLAPILFR